jgi:hypothetical protein
MIKESGIKAAEPRKTPKAYPQKIRGRFYGDLRFILVFHSAFYYHLYYYKY